MDNLENIKKIAKLASLKFSDEQLETQGPQFEKVLHYIAEINKLDLEGIEPLTSVNDVYNVLREDEVKQMLTVKEALANATKKNESFYKVPKTLE